MSGHAEGDDAGPGADPPPNQQQFEEYKHIATSLLDSWPVQESRLRDVQRLWPVVDPSLSKGFLRAPLPIEEPSNKRQRTDNRPQPPPSPTASSPAAAAAQGGDDNATLPFPSFPGVRQQTIEKLMYDKVHRCGECPGCLKKIGRQRRGTCVVRKAVAEWDAQLGGVSPALVRQVKELLANPARHESGCQAATRCGACYACKVKTPYQRCATVVAILDRTLPPRLQHAVNHNINSAEQDNNNNTTAAWDAALPWRSDRERKESYHPASEGYFDDAQGGGGNGSSSESDSEEDLRWSGWAPWLPGGGGGTAGDSTGISNIVPRQPGPPEDKSEVWVCRAHTHIGDDNKINNKRTDNKTKDKKKRDTSTTSSSGGEGSSDTSEEEDEENDNSEGDDNSDSDDAKECGHMNSGRATRCLACKTTRWTGPTGELRARVAAALQTGAMAAGGRGLEDLAGTIAAKISHEAGSDPSVLLKIGAGSEADLVMDIMSELQAVRREMLEAKKKEMVGEVQEGEIKEVEKERGRREKQRVLGRVARKTALGKATRVLEDAVKEVVEDQAAKERWKIEASVSERGNQRVNNGLPRRQQQMINVATFPLNGTATLASASGGGGAGVNGGASSNALVGYTAFCKEVQAALLPSKPSTIQSSSHPQPHSTASSLCDLLFPLGPQEGTWNTTSLDYLSALLRTPSELTTLYNAAQQGGPLYLKKVLHSRLAAVQASVASAAAAAAAAREEEERLALAAALSPSQMYMPPTQQSQPDPFLPSPAAAAPPQPGNNSTMELQNGGVASLVDPLLQQGRSGTSIATSMGEAWRNRVGGGGGGGKVQNGGNNAADAVQEDSDLAERAEQHRLRLLQTVSASTLQLVYSLTHATLNKVSVREAKALVPKASRPTIPKFLERTQFSSFPPLPAPTWAHANPPSTAAAAAGTGTLDNTGVVQDGHKIAAPIPDCSRPVHSMISFVPRSKRARGKKNADLAPAPPISSEGAFAPYMPSESLMTPLEEPQRSQSHINNEENDEENEEENNEEGTKTAASSVNVYKVIKKCRTDARLVFKSALEMGVRPEVVAAAAQRSSVMAPRGRVIRKRKGTEEQEDGSSEEEEEGDE